MKILKFISVLILMLITQMSLANTSVVASDGVTYKKADRASDVKEITLQPGETVITVPASCDKPIKLDWLHQGRSCSSAEKVTDSAKEGVLLLPSETMLKLGLRHEIIVTLAGIGFMLLALVLFRLGFATSAAFAAFAGASAAVALAALAAVAAALAAFAVAAAAFAVAAAAEESKLFHIFFVIYLLLMSFLFFQLV